MGSWAHGGPWAPSCGNPGTPLVPEAPGGADSSLSSGSGLGLELGGGLTRLGCRLSQPTLELRPERWELPLRLGPGGPRWSIWRQPRLKL